MKGQLTIPTSFLRELKMKPGDFFLVKLIDNNIKLTPQTVIPRDQEYFRTKRWQRGERDADNDLISGMVYGPYDNPDDFLYALDKESPDEA